MTRRLQFMLAYGLYWVVYFCCCRVIFLAYNWKQTSHLSAPLILGVLLHGLRQDLSVASYLCVFPFLMIALSVVVPVRLLRIPVLVYTILALGLLTFLAVLDLGLFAAWGFRLDATPLMYLNTPKEMLASAAASPLASLLGILVAVLLVAGHVYRKRVQTILRDLPPAHAASVPLFLFAIAGLAVPARGGLQLAPINPSHAYFSANDFANQAALNASSNLSYSLIYSSDKTNLYAYEEEQRAQAIVRDLFATGPLEHPAPALTTARPNVIIVLWESFTAKAVASLGGLSGVTPRFDALAKEGLLFTRFYANGDRTDKGLVAALSGYPPQPRQSIIRIERKTARLPALGKSFKALGYTTSFYYGGELEFAHIKSYVLNSRFDRITSKGSFDPKDFNSKWGVHDHVLLERVLADLDHEPEPFFVVVFTLSSHEPFDVPVPTAIQGHDISSLFLNSLHYTDTAIGNFVDTAKARPWYANTLIVVSADHGSAWPGPSQRHEPARYHVPMLWLGGALRVRGGVVNTICSQTDIPATLLGQMGRAAPEYTWSRDVLDARTAGFAQYVFNDGMGYVCERGSLAFDNTGKRTLFKDPSLSDHDLEVSKALMQEWYRDFLNR